MKIKILSVALYIPMHIVIRNIIKTNHTPLISSLNSPVSDAVLRYLAISPSQQSSTSKIAIKAHASSQYAGFEKYNKAAAIIADNTLKKVTLPADILVCRKSLVGYIDIGRSMFRSSQSLARDLSREFWHNILNWAIDSIAVSVLA